MNLSSTMFCSSFITCATLLLVNLSMFEAGHMQQTAHVYTGTMWVDYQFDKGIMLKVSGSHVTRRHPVYVELASCHSMNSSFSSVMVCRLRNISGSVAAKCYIMITSSLLISSACSFITALLYKTATAADAKNKSILLGKKSKDNGLKQASQS